MSLQDEDNTIVTVGVGWPSTDGYVITDTKKMLLGDFNTMASENSEEYFKEMAGDNLVYLHIAESNRNQKAA